MRSEFEQLRAGVDPITPLFVLVDPMVGEPLPGAGAFDADSDTKSLREQLWEREVTPVVLAKSIPLPPHQHPYLLHLHGPTDPLFELTYTLADAERVAAQAEGIEGEGRAAHRIGGWLQSGMPPAAVAELIAGLCRVSTQVPVAATYLRLADRRVLDLLRHVVGEERIVAQFGRLQSWTYLDATGMQQCLRAAGKDGGKLVLTPQEWQRMAKGSKLHRALARHLGEQAMANEPLKAIDYLTAENALANAATAKSRWPQRFDGEDDEVAWAVLTLRYPSILQLASVHELLEAPGEEDAPPEPFRYLVRDLIKLLEHSQQHLNSPVHDT